MDQDATLERYKAKPLNTIIEIVKVSKLRFVVLFIFFLNICLCAINFVGFVMVPDIFTVYFNIDIGLLSWTVQIYGVVFAIIIFPLMAWTKVRLGKKQRINQGGKW